MDIEQLSALAIERLEQQRAYVQERFQEDLHVLTKVISEQIANSKDTLEDVVDRILGLYVPSPIGSDLPFRLIPLAFWESPMGEVLNAARQRVYAISDLTSIADAVAKTGKSRSSILDYLYDGRLKPIRVNQQGKGQYFLTPADMAIIHAIPPRRGFENSPDTSVEQGDEG
jgi:hypothetical protein